MPVLVVTDSTAYLPEGFAKRLGIRVIPLHVTVDEQSALEGTDLGPDDVARALNERRAVSTSRPTPEEFAEVYREVLAEAEVVVSIHLSRQLSGTWEAARIGAQQVDRRRIRVIDSRTAAMGLGFAVLAAATAAAQGCGPDEVEAAAVDIAGRSRMFFCVPTLEHLRRGGRIGAATALLGTALAIKPLLHVQDGRIVPLEKARTTARAVSRLVDLACEAAGSGPVGLAVHHLAAPELAIELASRLEERLPHSSGCLISEVGAVIGAHTGPGVLGVVVVPGWVPAAGWPHEP
jgi:DegV family protein with EDD domain